MEDLQGRQSVHGAPWDHSLLGLGRGGEWRGEITSKFSHLQRNAGKLESIEKGIKEIIQETKNMPKFDRFKRFIIL